jgi:hypothetical protein
LLTTSIPVAKKPSDEQPAKGQATIKIERDLHRIARSLAGYYDQELGHLFDDILRPELLRRHAEMIDEVQRAQKRKPKEGE